MRLWGVTAFAVAMGWVEAAVVVYLRALYYPQGFVIPQKIGFPFIRFGPVPELKVFSPRDMKTEIIREAATLVMLLTVAWLAGRKLRTRWAAFIWAFGVWDLTYYLWLYVLIGWPPALTTTDVFFLIPTPWLGPVWLPMVCSLVLVWWGAKWFRE